MPVTGSRYRTKFSNRGFAASNRALPSEIAITFLIFASWYSLFKALYILKKISLYIAISDCWCSSLWKLWVILSIEASILNFYSVWRNLCEYWFLLILHCVLWIRKMRLWWRRMPLENRCRIFKIWISYLFLRYGFGSIITEKACWFSEVVES